MRHSLKGSRQQGPCERGGWENTGQKPWLSTYYEKKEKIAWVLVSSLSLAAPGKRVSTVLWREWGDPELGSAQPLLVPVALKSLFSSQRVRSWCGDVSPRADGLQQGL